MRSGDSQNVYIRLGGKVGGVAQDVTAVDAEERVQAEVWQQGMRLVLWA